MIDYFVLTMKRTFDFKGRSRRAEYWYFMLANVVLNIIASALDSTLFTESQDDVGLAGVIVALALLIPGISVLFRRLHDIGKTAWWSLLFLIPLVNLVMALFWLTRDGVADNKYGRNPKSTGASDDLLAQFD